VRAQTRCIGGGVGKKTRGFSSPSCRGFDCKSWKESKGKGVGSSENICAYWKEGGGERNAESGSGRVKGGESAGLSRQGTKRITSLSRASIREAVDVK